MSFESRNAEILALFKAAGKEVPHEDSDIGRAVSILQTICDSQSHDIPTPSDALEDVKAELEEKGWEFFDQDGPNYPHAQNPGRTKLDFVDTDFWKVIFWAAEEEGIDTSDIASDIFEALDEIEMHLGEDDFTLDFDGNEYRLIKEEDIWGIYVEEIQRTVEECYDLNLDKLPPFIAFEIDWEATARNCYADGYGHTFSGYDGSEEEAAGYYIFRTN